MKDTYLYLDGAYGDTSWVTYNAPTKEQWEDWECGELHIFMIHHDNTILEPHGINNWQAVKVSQ